MCEFCIRHGDGRRWYLNASNYATELLNDARREKYIRDFIPDVSRYATRWLRLMDAGRKTVPGITRWLAVRKAERMKEIHFGQVIPLEDVEAAMAVAGHVARLPCICRETLGQGEEAVCYLLAADPEKLGLRHLLGASPEGIPYVESLEAVAPSQALDEMGALERKGNIHTIWTFITPFIGAICNCQPQGCLALNFGSRGLRLYFPGEWKASVDETSCAGCGQCRETCLFAAVTLVNATARIDRERCHGCGICRPTCPVSALSLEPAAPPPAKGTPQ